MVKKLPTDAAVFSRARARQIPLLSLIEDIFHVGEANEGTALFVHLVMKQDHNAVRIRLEEWTWKANGTQIVVPDRHVKNIVGAMEIPLTDLPNTIASYILNGRTQASQLCVNDIISAYEDDLNGESRIWGSTTHKRIK